MNSRSETVQRFRLFAAGADLDVFEGALAISELVDPQEDLDTARRSVEELSDRIRAQRNSGVPACEALRRVLFSEGGFSGDTDSYDDPANSSVAHVLRTRRGMPITLSIVTVEIGRRAGLDLSGIGLPGHFVVGGPTLPAGAYLDPFDGGTLCDASSLADRVSGILGTSVELPPEVFEPDSARAILVRVLSNLRGSYERRERFEEALAALDCAEALDPDDAAYRRERGLLLLKSNRPIEAVAELEAYVDLVGDDDAEAVRKLISILRDGLESEGDSDDVEVAEKKLFTLDQARQLLPQVQQITTDAALRYAQLGAGDEAEEERRSVVHQWARAVTALGAEIKGLWLVDFDSGAGYYCWKYPEAGLDYFHGYEEGFTGRLPLQ